LDQDWPMTVSICTDYIIIWWKQPKAPKRKQKQRIALTLVSIKQSKSDQNIENIPIFEASCLMAYYSVQINFSLGR